MLTADRQCGVYEIRPLICRLWGLTRSMPCPYGCRPERVIEDDEAFLMIMRADRIGGLPSGREERIAQDIEKQMRWLGEEEMRRRARTIARHTIVRPSVDGRHKLAKSIFEK
jgi:Fe-S-cluster containining protein